MKIIMILMILFLQIPVKVVADIDEVKFQFIKLDINGDGLISKKERINNPELFRFTNLFSQGDFVLSDINQDRYIDMEEFVANEEITY